MRNLKCRITIMVCALLFLITGCGKAGSNRNTGQETTENSGLKDNVISWQASYFRLENSYDLALAAEHLYGCYVKDDRILLDIINKEKCFVEETLVLPDASFIAGMAADQGGNVYLLGNKGDSTGLWKIDAGGSLQDYKEMELEDTEKAQDLLLKGIYTDQNGYLFVWCEMIVPEIETFESGEREVWHWEDRVYIKGRATENLFL